MQYRTCNFTPAPCTTHISFGVKERRKSGKWCGSKGLEPTTRSYVHHCSISIDPSQDEKVELFVSDVNSHLRQRQEHERLKTIIARIESYEPVVSERERAEHSRAIQFSLVPT